MFPPEILLAYLAAVMLVVISPGPVNILAISRGISQGTASHLAYQRMRTDTAQR